MPLSAKEDLDDNCPQPYDNSFKFTNVLAKELHFPPNEKLRMCLSSITLANAETFLNEQLKKSTAKTSSDLKKAVTSIYKELSY